MLEKMDAFFEARLADYDSHMLTDIEGAEEFYPFTASRLPEGEILDLGCGTGLELGYYFARCPGSAVTGIDLAEGMLQALKEKFPDKNLTLIQGSYFDVPLGENCFDAAVSVESLHHFTAAEKLPLYEKLCKALRPGGFFVLTDYFAPTEALENAYRAEYLRLRDAQGITDGEFYHYDTPLTVENETKTLLAAGFSRVEALRRWGATHTLKVYK